MDRLWAPWRMSYILSEANRTEPEACIFCALPEAGPEAFRENLILSCGRLAFVIMNRYPYNNAHLMVVPRRHLPDPSELPELDYRVLCELLRRTTAALRQAVKPHGINLGMNLGRTAGAGIDEHCHFHLVPRWNGDTNFMPVVGEVKVISQGLLEGYDCLHPFLADLAPLVEKELGCEG